MDFWKCWNVWRLLCEGRVWMDLEVLLCCGRCVAALSGGHVCHGARESRCWGRSQQVLWGVRRPIWMLITFLACVTLIVPQVWGKCSWRVACQWKLPKSTECIKLGTLRQLASEREDREGWKPVMPPYHSQSWVLQWVFLRSRRVLKGLQAVWLRHHWSLEYYSFPCCRAEMMKKTCCLHFPSSVSHQNIAYFWTWWSESLSGSKILWFLLRFRTPSKFILILHSSLQSGESWTVTSLAVQWLRLCTPRAWGLVSIPGQGARSHTPQLSIHMCCNLRKVLQAQQRSEIPHATKETRHSQEKIN